MNTTRQHKSRQTQRYARMKAGWNKIHNIVVTRAYGWGEREGFDAKGAWFDFLSNFGRHQLPVYKEAIRTYKGPVKFGLSNKAYGFYDDEGISFSLDNSHYALYACNAINGFDDFWRHFDEVRLREGEEANKKYKKMCELNFRKTVYHRWYGHTEADATALAQKLTNELPEKWKKYFQYTVVRHSDQTFDICFGPINAASPRPHAMKNLVKAYTEINYKARYFEINIIGKF